jgi:hypothetical protein
MIRTAFAYLVAPLLYVTGLRFTKDYRNGSHLGPRIVYACVDTVKANVLAGLTL